MLFLIAKKYAIIVILRIFMNLNELFYVVKN